MSVNRLRSLTAISLAALYGVVGLTGESLHYLATDGWSFWTANDDHDSGGFYHVHAPDYHGHYHRHSHHHGHSHGHAHSHDHAVDTLARKVESKSILGVEFTTSTYTHEPHACPALALVSTLKLSHAGRSSALLIFDSVFAPSSEARCIPAFKVTLRLCPRGPPTGNLA